MTVLKTRTHSSFDSVRTLPGFWPVVSEFSYSESHGLNLAEQSSVSLVDGGPHSLDLIVISSTVGETRGSS